MIVMVRLGYCMHHYLVLKEALLLLALLLFDLHVVQCSLLLLDLSCALLPLLVTLGLALDAFELSVVNHLGNVSEVDQ